MMHQEPESEHRDADEKKNKPYNKNMLNRISKVMQFLDRHSGGLSALGTLVIAIFTGVLAIATYKLKQLGDKQSGDVEQSIAIARISAETARLTMYASVRANLTVTNISLGFLTGGPQNSAEIRTIISNGGRATGYIKKAVIILVIAPGSVVLPDSPNYSAPEDPTFIVAIAPGVPFQKPAEKIQPRNARFEPVILTDDQINRIQTGVDRLFVYGFLRYEDDSTAMGEGSTTSGFCVTYARGSIPQFGTGVPLVSCGYTAYLYNRKDS